jgi:NDP-hexose-3-ketoreductase
MKVAVWGLGQHAINNIIPALHASNHFSLYGVCSRNVKNLEQISEQFSCNSWKTPEIMLQDNSVDIICLSTPPGLHYSQGLKILNARKHFWCEKPLTNNKQHSLDLLSVAKSRKLSIFEGFMYLYHPQFLKLKKILSEELLGELQEINIRFELPKLDNPGYRENKDLGASAIFDIGVYPISLILSLFSKRDIKILSVDMNESSDGFDLGGKVVIEINGKVSCSMEWAYNREYLNEISIKGSNCRLFSEKIFSKKPDYLPYFKIMNQNDIFYTIESEKANHFELMFDSFYSLLGDQAEMNSQRNAILDVSDFVDRIINFN